MWELIVGIGLLALLFYSYTDKGQMRDGGGSNSSSSSASTKTSEQSTTETKSDK